MMFFSKKMVGIDIGDYAIKIAELSQRGKRVSLKNYAWAKTPDAVKNSPDAAAQALRQMMDEAGITTKKALFTIPDTLYFCASFEIPPMPEKEIAGAITYNASRYLTVPVAEVTLDWQIVQPPRAGAPIRIFAAAVPNAVIEQYRSIAAKAGLNLIAIEAEAFSIAAALVPSDAHPVSIIDAGAKSSTITVVDHATVKESYTFGAENKPLAESLSAHAQEVNNKFFNQEHKHVEEIYLTGGNSAAGLKDVLAQNTHKPVAIRNSFSAISFPSVFSNVLAELSPLFAGAVGAALNGLKL